MKKAFLAIILLLPFWAQSQDPGVRETMIQAPDNEAIEMAILNPQSEFYYPALILRYENADTTLTLDHYRHLYYGYAFHDNYRPLETIYAADSVNMVFETVQNDEFNNDEIRHIMAFSSQVLRYSPFSIKHLNLMAYGYYMLGDEQKAMAYSDKMYRIMEAIRSSGTGIKEESPWHILYREDAQDLLASWDLNLSKRMIMSSSVEYWSLLVKHGDNKGYYFDVSRLYWKKPELQNEKRKFEFNPKTNPRSNQFVRPLTY